MNVIYDLLLCIDVVEVRLLKTPGPPTSARHGYHPGPDSPPAWETETVDIDPFLDAHCCSAAQPPKEATS
jgi:hypothetical protein